MTEKKKRFTKCDDGTFCLLDNGKGLEYDEVIDLFNELYEENEQLKSELGEKDIQLDFLKSENKHMSDLVNENKELKKQIKVLDDIIDGLTETIFHYNIEEEF